jgi:hypothetical protein
MQSDTAAAQYTLRRPGETRSSSDLTEGAPAEKPKKKRLLGDSAALGVTQVVAYYQAPSLGGATGVSALLTRNKARTDPQVAYPAAKQKAKAAAAVSCGGVTRSGRRQSVLRFTPKQGQFYLSPGTATTRGRAIP